MKDFSAIVSCKARLDHLRQTLPALCSLPLKEVILVDYGCPEESGKWASQHHPSVKVVHVTDDPGFNLPRARNLGAEQATAEYLIFVDADVTMKPAALETLDEILAENVYVTIKTTGNDLRGFCAVPRAKFNQVSGYDDLLKNYGMEDVEFTTRLLQRGLNHKQISAELFDVITHDNALRAKYMSGSLAKNILIATVYQEFVQRFRPMSGRNQLRREIREEIHAAAVGLVTQLINAKDPSGGIRLNMQLPNEVRDSFVGGDMDWEFEMTMTMKPKDPQAFKRRHQSVLHYKKSQ